MKQSDPQLKIRMPLELKEKIEAGARQNNRSVTSEVVALLSDECPIILGVEYIDRITGFRGIATGFCTYISGCNQALLSPPVSATGEHRDPHWFDAQRLERSSSDAPITLDNGATPGCDKPAPIR